MATQPLVFQGSRLILNVDTGATGEGRVGILDSAGRAIEGFDVGDCDVVNIDRFDHTVTWRRGSGDVSSVAGQPVRLRFKMRGTRLYGLQFV